MAKPHDLMLLVMYSIFVNIDPYGTIFIVINYFGCGQLVLWWLVLGHQKSKDLTPKLEATQTDEDVTTVTEDNAS